MIDFDRAAADWDADPARHERARILAERIRMILPLAPGMTALEYGCGTGLLSFALRPHIGHITLADDSTEMLKVLRRKIAASGAAGMTPLRLDLGRNNVPSIGVDLIYTLMVLHHVFDVDRILSSFYKMLNAPGYLAVADLDAEDGSFHGPDFTGHHGFDRSIIGGKAEAAGFSNIRFETAMTVTGKLEKALRSYPLFLMTAEKGIGRGEIPHETEIRSK
jgi:ubiquinone/menaquinone biosynthesis C-methylase UbiE